MAARTERRAVAARRPVVVGRVRPSAVVGQVECSRTRVVDIQRSRLLAAAVRAVDELGWANTTVADVVARSRISRRTFYELFANREECMGAVLEDILARLARELAGAGLEGVEWRVRVRRGLSAILVFFDREPVLARVCVVQALSGGPEVLARREEILAVLACVVDEGREGRGAGARGVECSSLTAEGLVGAAFGILYARLLKGQRQPLAGLVGELMAMIVLPYLGPAAARREQTHQVPASVTPSGVQRPVLPDRMAVDPLESVPMRLTYRTSRVLEGVAELAGGGVSPSNREIADYAGIQDPGQVSKLLRRLERLGLLANSGQGHAKGEPNAWRLTKRGELVAQSIRTHTSAAEAVERGARPTRLRGAGEHPPPDSINGPADTRPAGRKR